MSIALGTPVGNVTFLFDALRPSYPDWYPSAEMRATVETMLAQEDVEKVQTVQAAINALSTEDKSSLVRRFAARGEALSKCSDLQMVILSGDADLYAKVKRFLPS